MIQLTDTQQLGTHIYRRLPRQLEPGASVTNHQSESHAGCLSLDALLC